MLEHSFNLAACIKPMSLEYFITYKAENHYESMVNDAHWQFLIIPEHNINQEFITVDFKNSIDAYNEHSINGYGFKTIRVQPKSKFKHITFEASFKLIKNNVNPFDFEPNSDIAIDYQKVMELDFKVDFEPFLRQTHYTSIPTETKTLFSFDTHKSIFENLQALNQWVFEKIYYAPEVTDVYTTLDQIIKHRQGVCQDFTHLFCALARQNHIPARYISGYLHQGNGYFGDSQMHAWAEAYIPNLGWIGFDPTNNILANNSHIKVAHGKDYNDCSPLRGVVYASGSNETKHSVLVSHQQQQ
ncbi:transglutaminase-like putative cysteine protease [Maribacter polysiphoniae]|nr:transglutaminase-like putative cysteine protease [Maribacter polysiphoniae]